MKMIFKMKKKSAVLPTVTVVVFGAGGVGKTSLIRRYMYNTFEEHYSPTLEDAFRKVIDYRGGLADLNIIDMAGSYQFPAMRRHAIEHGHGFLIVYAVDDPLSVEEAKRLCNEISEVKKGQRVPLLFVCNKIDKLNEQNHNFIVSKRDDLLVGTGELTGAGETSAKNNVNVGIIFSRILELMAKDTNEKEGKTGCNEQIKPQVNRKHSKLRRYAWWRALRKYFRMR